MSTLNTPETVEIRLMGETFLLTSDILQKYNTHGPRYTSYPTAPMWKDAFGPEAYREAVQTSQGDLPLSLYVHLPFCESRCLFCGCNVVITRQKDQAEKYLTYLFQEMERVAAHMDTRRPVVQFHWGGGTPTYLSTEQMERLFAFQKNLFNLAPDAEIGIEVDPRVTTPEQIECLKALGFNRISLGVQDFDPKVQEAIHRIQPMDMTESMVQQCRDLGFESLNMDLIYGLPHQTVETFKLTLAEIIRLSPDRIALYNYAHVPWMAPHQAHMPESALPSGPEKLRIFQQAIHRLTAAGYVYIGMDHFAKPNDELTLAQERGTLRRNFMGYTTQAGSDLYAFGVSGISGLQGYYAQNQRKLTDYYQVLDEGQIPTMRGYALSMDDRMRRAIISQVLCHGSLNYAEIEAEYGIPAFQTHFEAALAKLTDAAADNLLHFHADGFTLTPLGRIFSRNIAMVFDAYLEQQPSGEKPLFSKTL